MGHTRAHGRTVRRLQAALLTLITLACTLATYDAHARRPWCDALPASLEIALDQVGCDTALHTGSARLAWRSSIRAPEALAPFLRLPPPGAVGTLGRYDRVALPPVSLPSSNRPALAERSHRELLVRMGVLATISTTLMFAIEPPRTARWDSTSSLDRDASNALRASSRGGRRAADLASDVLLASVGAQLATDWYLQRDVYPGLASVYADGSWLMLNGIANHVAKASGGRRRPYASPCLLDPDYIEDCGSGRDDNASFYSGHASWSATLAGLVCARRQAIEHADQTRIRWGDVAWCGFAIGASVATGLLRVSADRHRLSDVGAGWTAGFVTGFVLPRAFDYRSADGGPFSRFQLAPFRRESAWGLATSFRF